MSNHQTSAVLPFLLIATLFFSSSILNGQISEIRSPSTAPEYPEPQPPAPLPSSAQNPTLRKYSFKFARATDALRILQQLTQDSCTGIAVDERTNSLLFLSDDENARELEEVLKEVLTNLDVEAPPQVNGVSLSVPALGPKPLAFDFSVGILPSVSIESLKQQSSELERKTHQLADKLKQSMSPSEPDRSELQAAVRKSFEARQALQRAELADLAQRMKSMQQSIDMRDKLREKIVQKRVEDLLNPNLKWDMTRVNSESTRSTAKEDSIGASEFYSSEEMRAALQGTWTVRAFQAGDQGDDRLSQVVVRGDLLLMHTIVSEKVLGISPWKLVWPDSDKPFEVEIIWDSNSNPEQKRGMPGRIAYDGKRFQLAFGEKRPSEICPGEKITYIDCFRDNTEDRSKAARTRAPTSPQATERPVLDAIQQPIARAIWEIVNQLSVSAPKPPFGIVLTEIESNTKEQLADFKEEIREQIDSELKTYGHLIVASRRVAEATLSSLHLKTKDLLLPKQQAQFFEALEKEGQSAQFILLTKLIRDDSTNYLLTFELIDRSGRSYKSTAQVSKTNPENSIAAANSSLLPQSIPPSPTSAPYDPGKRPETIIMERIQGKWIAESMLSAGRISLSDDARPFEVWITGNEMRFKVGEQYLNGPIPMLLTGPSGSYRSLESADQPLPMDFVMDPNGEQVTMHGIIASDGFTLSICFADGDESKKNGFRPTSFIPGSKVTVIKCHRAPTSTANKPGEADLSTPQATLDYLHRYSLDHPMAVPVECYTEAALQELSGVMLQQLCFMSGLSQIGLQTGGVIGVKDNAPIIAGTAPSFHLRVDALLKEHTLPTPPEECKKAFELLAKLTLGAALGSNESLVRPDRELFRLAAGILKSPKEFLPKAGELSERFNNISDDDDLPKKESKAQPKYVIKIDGDEATATQIVDSDKPSVPISFKLQRINQRWLVSEVFSDEILNQMISSMSQVLGTMSAIQAEVANQRDSSEFKRAPDADKSLYSGQTLSWWLDSYWDNATANPKSPENSAQEYVASEAIRKLRDNPECKAAIEAALAKWFASVEHEVNEIQLTRAAKCIVTIAGPSHQETAVNFLFKVWKRIPLLTHEQLVEAADDASELNQLLSQLALNDQLAIQFADRLTNGNSTDRSLVVYGLLSLMGRFGIETNKDLTELENWLRKHAERLAPAIEAASKDANEHIRFIALIQLATLIHATKLDPESVRLPTILLAAASDASPDVRYIAIDLLTSKEFASAIKSQNAQFTSMLISAVESDSSIDVRYSALNALMHMNVEAELVHKTLMEWAKSDEHEKVKYALDLTLRNYQSGNRTQSIDELIELLSDPEWGTKVEVNYNNWSTHHRWARQYALAILERYGAHAHRALPTLEAEVARNNKDMLSFATKALDSVRGYCPDRPIDKLQGQWEFVSIQQPEDSTAFFEFQAASEEKPATIITVTGTQVKLGDRVLAEISGYPGTTGFVMLLDPEGKKRHCNGSIHFNSEYHISSAAGPEWLKLDICELHSDWNATNATQQTYEFRPVKISR